MKILKISLAVILCCATLNSLAAPPKSKLTPKAKLKLNSMPQPQPLPQPPSVPKVCGNISIDTSIMLTFDELVNLSSKDTSTVELQQKADKLLNSAFVDNSISCNEKTVMESPVLGSYIRAASWNIERGRNIERIKKVFLEPRDIAGQLTDNTVRSKAKFLEEAEILRKSQIVFLNEVDVGMTRTGYKNVVEDLAKSLGYNYAYGSEFLEVDPVHLGLEDYVWSEERFLFGDKKPEIDKNNYKGMHGTAILSKFPLENVKVIRLSNYYDWYTSERQRVSELESLKRNVADKIFREDMLREIRYGSRMALVADVKIPGLSDPVTLVAVHLENRTIPENRRRQMVELLSKLQDIKNPIILGGDMNTTLVDGSPTSVKKEVQRHLRDPHYVARTLILYATPYGMTISPMLTVSNVIRKYTDPTVRSIPIISPNKERELFDSIKDFKFDDGSVFDFRGTDDAAVGKAKFLGNSNQRAAKGFVPTFIFNRPMVVGKYKLDWFFVKPYIKDADDKGQSFKMAPHYGRTLFNLNYLPSAPLSDHAPITVDLPLAEPEKNVTRIYEGD